MGSFLPSNTTSLLLSLTPQKLATSYTSFDLSSYWDAISQSLPDSSHPPASVSSPRVIHFSLLIHLLCVIPAFFLAFPLYSMKKGTRAHKILGRVFMALMTIGVGMTYNIKLLRRNDSHRGGFYPPAPATYTIVLSHLPDFLCNLSPSFFPGLFCHFSLFHLGTTITLSHIVLSLVAIKRGDLETHKRWTFWVMVCNVFYIFQTHGHLLKAGNVDL